MPTLFGNDMFTEEESQRIQLLLERKLAAEEMGNRSGGGKTKLYYVEAHQAINFANYIFDFNGWSSSIKEFQVDYVEEKGGRWFIGISCIVKIMLRDGTFHEDVGYGTCANMPHRGEALEKAKKEASSDALKRTLRLFGNGLGNCIYDKDYLAKLGKGTVVNQPLDLSKNRAKKRKFVPIKDEFAPAVKPEPGMGQEWTATAAATSPTASNYGSNYNQPPPSTTLAGSPKFNRTQTNAASAAAAHSQVAAGAVGVASVNPYARQQPPLTVPSPNWNSPIVKQEMTSPLINTSGPSDAHPTAQSTTILSATQHPRPQPPYNAAGRPQTNTDAATAPQPTQTWQTKTAIMQQSVVAPNPHACQSIRPAQHQLPSLSSSQMPPLQSSYGQQVPSHSAGAHSSVSAEVVAPPQPAPLVRASPSYLVPPAAPSKVDADLDDDLLMNIVERHSPQKAKVATPTGGTPPTTIVAVRQLQLHEQKEQKSNSTHCSPNNPSATAATKSQIFSVSDLLADHDADNKENL